MIRRPDATVTCFFCVDVYTLRERLRRVSKEDLIENVPIPRELPRVLTNS